MSTVLLSSRQGITLDPGESPHDILGLLVEATIPAGQTCMDCTLQYKSGLQGQETADPVRLEITYQGVGRLPSTALHRVRVCEVDCFPKGEIPGWPQWALGSAMGSFRVQGGLYQICGLGSGYGGTSDELLSLSHIANSEYEMRASLESLEGTGLGGVEARTFTGTAPDPEESYVRISAHRLVTGGIQIRSSFRTERGADAASGNGQAVAATLPVILRVTGKEGIHTCDFSTDGGRTFQPHLRVDGRGTGLDAPSFRAGMAQASEGGSRSVASFSDPILHVDQSVELPRLATPAQAFLVATRSPTRITLTGKGLAAVEEVTVAGIPAKILKRDEASLFFEVRAGKARQG